MCWHSFVNTKYLINRANVVAYFLSQLQVLDDPIAIDYSFPNEHLFSIESYNPWFTDIANYLATGRTPWHVSPKKHHLLVEKSFNFSWIARLMFYTGPNQVTHWCIREDETYDILQACHDERCGGHFATKRIAYKILTPRYYWPTLHKDATKYTRWCDRCQRMGRPTKSDEIPLQPQVVVTPFDKWGIDFIGPIEPSSHG